MAKNFTHTLFFIFHFLFAFPVFSQVAVDQNFKPIFTSDHTSISTMTQQADGKIIIGGTFKFLNSITYNNLARLNPDGTPDPSFEIGLGPNNIVEKVQIQKDNKLLVTGPFTHFNGQAAPGLIRLNSNGSVDAAFNKPAGLNFITASNIIVQPDDKILFNGVFYLYDQQRYTSVIRLNADGSLDKTFVAQVSDRFELAMALQADGKILLGGQGDTSGSILIRINPDGTPDHTFQPNTGTITKSIGEIALQDEKIIIAGTTDGTNMPFGGGITKVMRLQTNGSLDSTFPTGSFANELDNISNIRILPNKKILLAGFFNAFNANSISGIVQLNQDGTFDFDFRNDVMPNSIIRHILVQNDGKIIMGGVHIKVHGSADSRSLFRLHTDGSLDNSFAPVPGSNGLISKMALTPDFKLVVAGLFSNLNNKPVNSVVRLLGDGSLDESFKTVSLNYTTVRVLRVQPDGKTLIGGEAPFTSQKPFIPLQRLHVDGSQDTSFQIKLQGLYYISDLALQPDGKMVLVDRNKVYRLNSDGSLDETFQIGTAASASNRVGEVLLYSIGFQSDGKIIVSGTFEFFNGKNKKMIVRLLPDGSLDESFTGPAFSNMNHISTTAIQGDDKILIGGGFSLEDAAISHGIARLQANGPLDESFGATLAGSPHALWVEPSGKILAGGFFTQVNGATRNNLVRFNPNGSIDNGFTLGSEANSLGTGHDNSIFAITSLKQDGTIYIGGGFSQVNGNFHYSLARILPPLPAAPASFLASLSPPNEVALSWTDQANNELGYEIQRSTSATTRFVAIHTTPANVSTFTDKDLQGGTTYYYRIRSFNSGGPAAFSAELSLTTEKLNQTISFNPLADQEADAAPFALQASSSSGLPVSFTLVSGPATLDHSQVTITGAGVIRIKASQQGSENFHPAQEVIQEFTVHQANPTALQVSNITATGLMLKWEGESPEFKVLRKTTASSTSPDDGEVVYEGPDKTFTFTTQLHPGTAYFFTVYGKAAGTALYSRQSKKLATSTAAPAMEQVSAMAFLAGETGVKTAPDSPVSITITQPATQDGYIQVSTAANPSAPALPAGIKRLYADKYWKVTAVGMEAGTIKYSLSIDLKGLHNLPDISKVTILHRNQADQPWGDLLGQHPSVQQTIQDSVLVITNLNFFPEIALGVNMVTGIEQAAPLTFRLEQNYPNPFDQKTKVAYHLKQKADVLLEVIDGQGMVVQRLVQQVQAPGSYQVLLEAKNLRSRSLYFIRLQANGEKSVIKAVYQ